MKTETHGYPILTARQIREMDAAVERDYGLPLAVLMENAGRAVADAAERFSARRILVAAGAGNNGGDAMVAARILAGRGRSVTAALAKPAGELTGLAALAGRRFLDAGGGTVPLSDARWESADLIIDGLLGTGVAGEVREPARSAIEAVNASGRPVLSIDVPSGIDSDSSAEPAVAVRAAATVALSAYKPALVHYPAAAWAGEVILADIGTPEPLYPAPEGVVLSSAFARAALPAWGRDTNKGARGNLLVVAGSRGMAGAAAMCCNAASHAGAGLVYLACPETLLPVFETKLTVTVLRPVPDGGAARYVPAALDAVIAAAGTVDAVVVGPGLGSDDATADFVAALLPRIETPLLIDADGLNILASRGLKPPPHVVLTPHPGEMGRLLGRSVPEVQADRAASAREAAERFGCAVVLKGAHTVIAAPGRPVVVNLVSDPVLATAGSGDVLSGVIGALLSQKVDPFDAAAAGVRWHGTAGVLAASKWGGTLAATDVIGVLSLAREAIRNNHETELLV